MPILKDEMFDIIHIILSGEDAELVQNIRKTLGTKSKTKIVASYHSTGEASDRFLTLIHQKGIDLTGASLIFCPYRDSAGLIKHLFKAPVYILPDPADTSTIKRYHNPSRTRNNIALFIADDKRLHFNFLHSIGNSRYSMQIFYRGSSGFRPELFNDALRLNLDETEDKELCEVLDESRFAYIQDGFVRSEKYAIILSALSVPLVGDGLVETIRRTSPSSLLYLKDDRAMLSFAERLLEDDSFCREIGELAQLESEYYNYENTKKRLLELVLRV
jgi:hypothetical protein